MNNNFLPLICDSCTNTGVFEFEHSNSCAIRFVTLSGVFTFEENSNAGTQRVICKCGDLIYFGRTSKKLVLS
jgi:hypothetical protein